MSIQNFFKSLTLTATRRPPIRRSPPASRLCLEALEDRTVPAFLTPVNYPVGGYPQAVISGDFNNDSILDLAVANSNGRTVGVLLGNGDGTFRNAVNTSADYPDSLAAGDFNNDTVLDLATASDYGINVLLGNGDGTFQNARTIYVDSYERSVAVGDFNADGDLDLGVMSN